MAKDDVGPVIWLADLDTIVDMVEQVVIERRPEVLDNAQRAGGLSRPSTGQPPAIVGKASLSPGEQQMPAFAAASIAN